VPKDWDAVVTGGGDSSGDIAELRADAAAFCSVGILTAILHAGQRADFPASESGARKDLPQWEQRTTIGTRDSLV
jgi:hypothetical protein